MHLAELAINTRVLGNDEQGAKVTMIVMMVMMDTMDTLPFGRAVEGR